MREEGLLLEQIECTFFAVCVESQTAQVRTCTVCISLACLAGLHWPSYRFIVYSFIPTVHYKYRYKQQVEYKYDYL
jgi:hypothetical protein